MRHGGRASGDGEDIRDSRSVFEPVPVLICRLGTRSRGVLPPIQLLLAVVAFFYRAAEAQNPGPRQGRHCDGTLARHVCWPSSWVGCEVK